MAWDKFSVLINRDGQSINNKRCLGHTKCPHLKGVVPWYTEMFSFQGIGIEMFHWTEVSSFQGVGIEEFHCIQRCPHFRGLE